MTIMNFRELLALAKAGNEEAITELLRMYHPLLFQESIVDGEFDEDLYQELCIQFLYCIEKFRI